MGEDHGELGPAAVDPRGTEDLVMEARARPRDEGLRRLLHEYDVGGGVEYAINDRWSVRAEYRYYNFQNIIILIHTTCGFVCFYKIKNFEYCSTWL